MSLLCAQGAFATQVYRIDPSPIMTTSGNVPFSGYPGLYAIPGAAILLCTDSACATPATAYTDATGNTPCPTYAPVTLPGTSTCASASGAQGEFGFWIQPGTYYYEITVPNGQSFGPYPISSPNAFTVSGAGLVSADTSGNLASMANVLDCARSAGATADLKILATIAALPAAGGIADCRNMTGAQTIASNFFNGTSKPVTILFGAATFTVTSAISPTSNSRMIGAGQGITVFKKGANVDVIANQHINHVELASFTVDGNYSAGYTQNDLSFEFLNQFYFHNLELKNANLKGFACAACYNSDLGDNNGHNNQQDSFELGSIASAYYTITNVTNTNPIVITVSACSACTPVAIGNSVTIKGVTGTTAANGGPVGVIGVSGSTITVQIAGNGAYVNGGTLTNELDNSFNITIHDNRASSDGVYSFACIVPSSNLEPSPHDFRYTGNYAEMDPLYGFESKGCNHNSWVNNHSFGNTVHGFNLGTPGAGVLNYVEDSDTIIGNTSWNNGTPGAQVDGIYFNGTNSIIANNTVGDTRTSPGQKTGIQINLDGNNSITNNNGSGNATDLVCGPDVGTDTINQVGYVTTCP